MIAEWSNWPAAGFGGAWAVSLGQVVAAYLVVSLLGGLSWILTVELGRRVGHARRESRAAEASPVRMAVVIVRSKGPAVTW